MTELTLPEQVILLIYLILAALLGLVGNITVLYASLRYNALQLDQISVIFIRLDLAAVNLNDSKKSPSVYLPRILFTSKQIYPNFMT